jgi:hypothetical protein
LRDDPLSNICTPDADAISTLHAERKEAARGAVHLIEQL